MYKILLQVIILFYEFFISPIYFTFIFYLPLLLSTLLFRFFLCHLTFLLFFLSLSIAFAKKDLRLFYLNSSFDSLFNSCSLFKALKKFCSF